MATLSPANIRRAKISALVVVILVFIFWTDIAIAITAGVVGAFAPLFNFVMFIVGCSPFGPTDPSDKKGLALHLWGRWHLALIFILASRGSLLQSLEYAAQQMEELTSRSMLFSGEGLLFMGKYYVAPLLVTFLISRIHLFLRLRGTKLV